MFVYRSLFNVSFVSYKNNWQVRCQSCLLWWPSLGGFANIYCIYRSVTYLEYLKINKTILPFNFLNLRFLFCLVNCIFIALHKLEYSNWSLNETKQINCLFYINNLLPLLINIAIKRYIFQNSYLQWWSISLGEQYCQRVDSNPRPYSCRAELPMCAVNLQIRYLNLEIIGGKQSWANYSRNVIVFIIKKKKITEKYIFFKLVIF